MDGGPFTKPKLLGRIPLVPAYNTRRTTTNLNRDQRVQNMIPMAAENHATQKVSYYMEKRPGWVVMGALPSGVGTAIFDSSAFGATVIAIGDTNSEIYRDNTSMGSATGVIYWVSECTFSSITYVLMTSTDSTGWFLASDAHSQTAYTGDTHTNTVIDNIASTSGMYVGQALSGTGLQAGTRIAGITSGTAITVTPATTATNAGVSLTKTPLAKIIDADFPTNIVGWMVEKDGYVTVMTADAKVYHSDLNSVTAWSASAFVTCNDLTDGGVTVARTGGVLAAIGTKSIEFYYNAGNASGSVFSRYDDRTKYIGAYKKTGVFKTVTTLKDTVYFASSNVGVGVSLHALNGFDVTPISGDIMSQVFMGLSPDLLFAFEYAGQKFVNANLGGSTLAVTFDVSKHGFPIEMTNHWHTSESANQTRVMAVSPSASGVYQLVGTTLTFADTAGNYTAAIQVSDGGFGIANRKIVTHVDLIGDISTGTVTLKYSDDDGQNFTTHGSTFDMAVPRKRITKCGSYKGHRVWRIEQASSAALRVQFLDIYGYPT